MFNRDLITIIFLIFIVFETSASDVFVFRDSTGLPLLYVSGDVIKDKYNQVLYSINKKDIFRGVEQKRRNIELRIFAEEFFSNDWAKITSNRISEIWYHLSDGGYYFKPLEKSDRYLLIAYWRKNNLGGYSLYHGKNDSMIAYYNDGNADVQVLSILFHHFQMTHSMIASYTNDFLSYPSEVPDFSNTSGLIYSSGESYIWDGYTLEPQWEYDPNKIHTFDGYLFQNKNAQEIEHGFIWHNDTLSLRWQNPEEGVAWDGESLKKLNDLDQKIYIIEGNSILLTYKDRPKDKVYFKWTIEGEVPIPVIAFVLYVLDDL